MPFKAEVNNEFVISSFLSKNEWKELKEAKPSIRMTCCNAPGHMKRNMYGTQFFAHNSIGNCNYQPESTEHIFLKDKIARICKENGYDIVDIERRGTDWIADVYVEHKRKKYVFEIQLSKITFDILKRRSEKYISDGIQPVWILKEEDIEEYCRTNRFGYNHFHFTESNIHTTCFKDCGILISSISNFNTILQEEIKIDISNENSITLYNFISEIVSGKYIRNYFSKCVSTSFHDKFMSENKSERLSKFFNIKS